MNVSSNHSVTFNSTVHMPSIVSPTLETMSLSSNSVSDHANQAFNAANTKLASAGGTITGNLQVDGNLIITGTTTTVSANNLVVKDNMFYLNDQDYSSNVDLGFAGNYNDGTYRHTGLFRDASDGIWKFYDNYLPEPDAAVNIDTSNTSFRIATVFANVKTDVISVRGMDPLGVANSAFNAANTAVTSGQANVGAGLITTTAAYQANTGAGLLTRLPLAGGTLTGASTVAVSTWAKWTLETTSVSARARQGSDSNGLNFTTNALWTGSAWAEDDSTKKKFAYIQHLGNGRHEFRTANTGTGISWVTSLTVDDNAVNSSVALQQGGNQVLHASNYGGYSTFSGAVTSGGNNGFKNDVYVVNTRNPIWNFGNASSYGLSYFQGSSGLGSLDTIGIHPNGTATGTGSTLMVTSSYTQSLGSLRAPLFYDSDDTSYYLDPANNSVVNKLATTSHLELGNNLGYPNIEWNASGSTTGMIIFYLPGTTSNYGMVHMVFDIYEYNSPRVATVVVGGHNWSTSWYNTGCNVVGYTDKSVRLGVKDNRYCVVFGGVGSGWNYGTIVLRKIHNGGFYNNIIDMQGNWSSTQTNTESFTSVTSDLRNLRTPSALEVDGIGYSYSSFRAPIFYDYNNTGYYLDPASSSNLLSTTTRNLYFAGTGGNSGAAADGYSLYQEAGDWAYPYPDLVIGYHTGIKIGGYYGYNGTRIYNNNPASGSLIASFGDGDNAFRSYDNIIAYASDRRLKENIVNLDNAVSKVLKLNGVTFDWKDMVKDLGFEPGAKHEVGVLAQEVQAVLPEAVEIAPFDYDWKMPNKSKSGESYLTVKYEKLVPLLIEAIKEQQQQIEELKKKVGIV